MFLEAGTDPEEGAAGGHDQREEREKERRGKGERRTKGKFYVGGYYRKFHKSCNSCNCNGHKD